MASRARWTLGADNNRIVNFAGAPRLIGHFIDVTISAALAHTLRGKVVALAHA